ncbi:hypothetical protein G8C15_05495 [Enterococcus casseliflavus]|nr:hypothetical protein [Enterococcus casseliflavus]
MIYPILYETNETDFFSLGLGPIKTATEAFVTEERNGSFILEGKVIVDDEVYPLLQENRIIKADASPALTDQRFRIKRIVPNHEGQAEIYAEHVSYLSQELPMKPEVFVNGNGNSALLIWKSAILDDNPFFVDSDITTDSKTNWRIDKVENPRQALGGVEGSILDVWGGEYRFDNYHISLLKKRGTTANTILAYGRNITDFEQERNIMTTYTTVYPFAIYTDDKEEERIVTIDGYVVDCDNITDYPNRNVLPVDFSNEFEHDEVPTKAKLKQLAQDYIKNNDIGIPKTSIKVSFLDLAQTADYADIATLETVELCDDVRVHYEKLGVDTIAKVIRTKWNVLRGAYEEIEIGEKRTTLSSIINDTQTSIKEIENQTGSAIIAANGKNMIFHGLFGENGEGEPTAIRVGDMWYKPNGEDTEFYIWDGTVWAFIMSTAKFDEIDKKVEELEADTEKAVENANNAVDKANEAVAKVDSLDKAVNTALEQSASAIDQAQQAIKDANNLLATVTDVQGTVTNISTVVDEINNQLAVKVSQTDFDKLKGTVDTQAVQISANTAEIALKASQSSVNTITGNVESIQSELKTQAGSITAINTKVEGNTTQIGTLQSSYNGLSSTIANVQNDFDNLQIGGRNMIIQSTAEHNKSMNTSYQVYSVTGHDLTQYIEVEPETQYIVSSKGISAASDHYFRINIFDSNKSGIARFVPTDAQTPYIFTTPANARFMRVGYPNDVYAKIERGNKETDWSPAPEDLATVTEMSNITQTVNDIQLTVADKVSQAQFTILSNQVTTTVSDVSNLGDKLDLTDIKARMAGGLFVTDDPEFRKGNNGLSVYNNAQNGVVTLIRESTGSTATQPTNSNTRMRITVTGAANPQFGGIVRQTNARINAKFVIRIIANLPIGRRFQYASNSLGTGGKHTWLTSFEGTGTWTEYMYLVECGTGGTFSNFGHLYVLNGATPTPESPLNWYIARYEIIDITQSQQSQITQLSDSINLRVEKNDVVNQINISTEGVLIAGKKIQITGETYIANAVIKTANIADLAITNTKIANATISSAKIINLDASKVTAGSLVGVNIKSASNGSLFEVQGNNLKMTKSNGDNLIMDTSGIYWKNTSGDVLFQTSNKLTTSDIFGTSEYNVYLAAFNETRSVTYASALTGSGGVNDYTYVNHRAAGLYAGFVEVNTGAGSNPTNVYIRPLTAENEVRITASGGTSSYARLRAGRLYANSLSINGATNAVQLYLQTSDEVRVKAGGEDSEAAAYRAIRASAFNTSSLAEYKMNIRPFAKNALDLIKESTVYEYNLISDPLVNEIGLVIGNGYNITDYVVNGDGVSQYRMNSLSWKAIQELDKKTTDEIELLKTKIEMLENQIRILQAA